MAKPVRHKRTYLACGWKDSFTIEFYDEHDKKAADELGIDPNPKEGYTRSEAIELCDRINPRGCQRRTYSKRPQQKLPPLNPKVEPHSQRTFYIL